MRTASGVLLSIAAAACLVSLASARADAPVTIEKSLLGVRILQTYHDVLARWGQPTLVVRGGEKVIYTPATDAQGNDLGGISSVSYEGGTGGGAPGGGPGSGGGPGLMGGRGGMGPGSGGMGPGSGGMGGKGMGGGGSTGSDPETSFGASGAYGWIYFNAKTHIYTIFAFNLEGRVMFIMERGKSGGMPTQRGVRLGDNVKALYDTYGWPDTIQDKEPGFILDYGTKYHAKFAVIKNNIVGIGVVLEESTKIPFFPESSGGGGGGPKMGGGGPGGGKFGGMRPPAGM